MEPIKYRGMYHSHPMGIIASDQHALEGKRCEQHKSCTVRCTYDWSRSHKRLLPIRASHKSYFDNNCTHTHVYVYTYTHTHTYPRRHRRIHTHKLLYTHTSEVDTNYTCTHISTLKMNPASRNTPLWHYTHKYTWLWRYDHQFHNAYTYTHTPCSIQDTCTCTCTRTHSHTQHIHTLTHKPPHPLTLTRIPPTYPHRYQEGHTPRPWSSEGGAGVLRTPQPGCVSEWHPLLRRTSRVLAD